MSEMRFVEALRVYAEAMAGKPAQTVIIAPAKRIERVREFFGPGVEFHPKEQPNQNKETGS